MRPRSAYLWIILLLTAYCGGAQTSRRGAFQADIQIRGGAAKYPELNGWSATVSDSAGSVRYRISKEVPYDVPYPALYLSDVEGRTILVSSFNGTVEFVDGRGTITRTLTPFGESTPEFERNIKCSVAGARAAFLLSTPAWDRARVFVTTLDGDELWRKDVEGTHAGEIFLASGGAHLVAGSYVAGTSPRFTTDLFDRRGEKIRTFAMLFRRADISPATGQLALTDRNSLLLTTLQDNAPVVRWSTDSKERIITGVCLLDRCVAIATEHILIEDGTPYYTEPRLVVLNEQGVLVADRRMQGRSTTPTNLVQTPKGVEMRGEAGKVSFAVEELLR